MIFDKLSRFIKTCINKKSYNVLDTCKVGKRSFIIFDRTYSSISWFFSVPGYSSIGHDSEWCKEIKNQLKFTLPIICFHFIFIIDTEKCFLYSGNSINLDLPSWIKVCIQSIECCLFNLSKITIKLSIVIFKVCIVTHSIIIIGTKYEQLVSYSNK